MEPIRCKNCGAPLGDRYKAFEYLYRTLALKAGENRDTTLENRPIDYTFDVHAEPIFTMLAIPPENYCCRIAIKTAWVPQI